MAKWLGILSCAPEAREARIGFSLLILLVAGALLVVGKVLMRIRCWPGFHLWGKRSFSLLAQMGNGGI